MGHQKSPVTAQVIVQMLFFVVLVPFLPLLISQLFSGMGQTQLERDHKVVKRSICLDAASWLSVPV